MAAMKKSSMTKSVHSKGRPTLGEAFANHTVPVDAHGEGEVLVRHARVIPVREAWLYGGARLRSPRLGTGGGGHRGWTARQRRG